ncbi:DNA repair and recombination protein RadB [archaeon]|jgi:DNA repair protein RadB|nr:DNA repair and recombination protein RadB [archaeon]
MEKIKRISAGSYDLNRFLHGGYESDIISTIYGPGGSGKTNFCMLAAVSVARKGGRVIFIDTEGGFSTDRFSQMHKGDTLEIEKSLQNIMLLKPTSFSEQENNFEALLKEIDRTEINLIIIDSIAMLYRLELAEAIQTEKQEKIQNVNRNLAKQLRTLNEIARKKNIPIIITNQVYASHVRDGFGENEMKRTNMVGGDLLKYWSKCLIELQQNIAKRKLVLRKHRSLPEKSMGFEVTNEGIRKKGLF